MDGLTINLAPAEGDAGGALVSAPDEARSAAQIDMPVDVAPARAPQTLWPQRLDIGWQCVSTPAGVV